MTTLATHYDPLLGEVLALPKSQPYINKITVAVATNSGTANRNNINAAILKAGNGGVLEFPAGGQIYNLDKNFIGSNNVLPALIIGNGATIKMADQAYTTVASGTLSSGSTSVTVTNASVFSSGDLIGITEENTTATYSVTIQSINGNVLTLASGLSFYSGSTLTVGAIVTRLDACMVFSTTSDRSIEIWGLYFDGNRSNRTRAVHWLYSAMVAIGGTSSRKQHSAWLHHCIFANGSTDALGVGDFNGCKISDCYFHDIDGSGIHYGGSGYSQDAQIIGNLFYKVFQFTDGSQGLGNEKQTATRYGHASQRGPITWSVGPKNTVVMGNTIDTTEGYALGNGMGADNAGIVLSGNIVSSAACGAFRFDGASGTVTVTGNLLSACGHATTYNSTSETTQISNFTGRNFLMTGNMLINSPVSIFGNNDGVKISDNYFDFLTLVYVGTSSWMTAAIVFSSCTGKCDVDISHNYFRGPRNATEWAALGGGFGCYAIRWTTGTGYGLTIKGNKFVGGSIGLLLNTTGAITGLNGSDNYFIDLYSSTGQNNSAAFYFTGSGAAHKGMRLNNNQMVMTSNGGGNIQAIGVYIKDSPTFECSQINGNTVYSQLTTSSQKGFDLSGACAGLTVNGNAFHLGGGVNNPAISMASATAEAWVTMNRVHNGNTSSLGSATTTAGNYST